MKLARFFGSIALHTISALFTAIAFALIAIDVWMLERGLERWLLVLMLIACGINLILDSFGKVIDAFDRWRWSRG
jgi:hypothetical protein